MSKHLTLGERIRQARKYRKMRSGELAAKIGVSQPCISRWERDQRAVPENRLHEIARVLNVPLTYLMNDLTLIARVGRQYRGTWREGRYE